MNPNPWRLPPRLRQALMVLHAVIAISWMGVDIAVLSLLLTARTTNDPVLVMSGFNAIGIIVPAAIPAISLGILITGLLLGLGTSWGLVQYWWVLVKLALSVIMTILVFVSLLPGVAGMAVISNPNASAEVLRASLGSLPTQRAHQNVHCDSTASGLRCFRIGTAK